MRYLISVILGAVVAVAIGAMVYGVPASMTGGLPGAVTGAADSVLEGAAETVGGLVGGGDGAPAGLAGFDSERQPATAETADLPPNRDAGSAEGWDTGTAMPVPPLPPVKNYTYNGEWLVRNDTGVKITTTHKYVKSPPCVPYLTANGKEARDMFGIPTPFPLDMRYEHAPDWLRVLDSNQAVVMGFEPKPCKYDEDGNGLGDGWEDGDGDGYADGFDDCTRPYVFSEADGGWWVQERAPPECARDSKAKMAELQPGVPEHLLPVTQPGLPRAGMPDPTTTPGTQIPYATALTGTVTRVIDGDTLQIDRETTIRLALVDTPERGQPGYEEAASFTRLKCPVGSTVVYDADDGQKQGSYGRLIAMVWCTGYNTNAAVPLNELLLAHGHAEIDGRHCSASEFGDDEWALRGGC